MKKKDNSKPGVITVFLALIFPLIFSIILVSVKSAIMLSAENYSKRIFNTALESALGDYYRPLYDEYHIFGLNMAADVQTANTTSLKQRMTESIDAAISTQGEYNAYPLSASEPEITSVTGMLEYDGGLFRKQATDYAKYDEAAEFIEMLLEKCNLIDGQNETSKVLKEKMALEEELAQIDKRVIQLMELIDGVKFDESEIMTDRKGKVKTEDYFIKIFQTGDINAANVGINNAKIYEAIKAKYVNPINLINSIRNHGTNYAAAKRSAESYTLVIAALDESIEKKEAQISQLKKNKAGAAAISKAENELKALEEERDEAADIQEEYLEQADEYRGNGITENNRFDNIFNRVYEKTKQALDIILEIRTEQQRLQPKVMEYGDLLSTAAEAIDLGTLSELSDTYSSMKKYVGLESESAEIEYDIDSIEETLINNLETLEQIDVMQFPGVPDDYSEAGEQRWCEMADRLIELYTSLSYESLTFDYSKLQFETEENSLFSGFTDIFSQGFYSLMIPDYGEISEKEIITGNLPSEWAGLLTEEKSENPADEVEDANASELIASAEESAGASLLGGIIKDSMLSLAEKIIYILYVNNSFDNYLTSEKKADRPTEYEMEYIIFGNQSDKDNIEAAAMRIMLLRLIINVAHVFTDSTKTARANSFAITVVGFAGLPFLTALVKYVVLFIWAFEQAVIETMALFMGREVSLITTSEVFAVRFEELLLINAQYVKAKAEKLKNPGVTLKYKDYLNIFLLLQSEVKQNYRTMDLIQSHIRYEYDMGFSFSNCIYGYEAKVQFTMPQKYPDYTYMHTGEVCYR